jgi:hypothetical protein
MDMNLYSRPRRHESDSRTASAGQVAPLLPEEPYGAATDSAGYLIWDFSWPAR